MSSNIDPGIAGGKASPVGRPMHRHYNPIEALLSSLSIDPTSTFTASNGPTAQGSRSVHADTGSSSGDSICLPISSAHSDRLTEVIYRSLLSCGETEGQAGSSTQRSAGLIRNPMSDAGTDAILDKEASIDVLRRNAFELRSVQRHMTLMRDHLDKTAGSSTAKGKAPTPWTNAATTSSAPGSPASRPGSPSWEAAASQPTTGLGPEYASERRGMPCGHIFRKGEAIWRCRDCALDDTCVLCEPCFNNSVHSREQHDVVFSVSASSGGCCDCGDEEAWKRDIECHFHSHQTTAGGEDSDMADAASAAPSPQDLSDAVQQTLGALLLPEVQRQFTANLRLWLDFILAVLEHAPAKQTLFPRSFSLGSSSGAIKKVRELPDLTQWSALVQRSTQDTKSSSRPSSPLSSPSPSQDEERLSPSDRHAFPMPPGAYEAFGSSQEQLLRSLMDTSNRLAGKREDPSASVQPELSSLAHDEAANKATEGRSYALILWNDEKHSFREVIDTVRAALGVTEHQARAVAERVDEYGRDILAVSSDPKLLVGYARKMAGIDLEVTIRPAFDVFCEELAHRMMSVIRDFADSSIYVLQSSHDGDASDDFTASAIIPRLLLCSALMDEWSVDQRQEGSFSSPHMNPQIFDPSRLSKLDGLLLMDQKLWKQARGWIREWYMAINASKLGRRFIAWRISVVYPKMIETFILREREPEHSVVSITVQLFSVPSIGSELVRHCGFLQRLLVILRSIYTGGLYPVESELRLQPSSETKSMASTQSMLLRQGHVRHIFHDVRYILQSAGVKGQLVADPRHLDYCLNFFTLFHAMLPEVRQTQHHIEYESETWIAVFGVSQLLAKQAKLLGEAFDHAPVSNIVTAINKTAMSAFEASMSLQQKDAANFEPLQTGVVSFGENEYSTIIFKVDKQATSFHHPVQWVLAELLRSFARIADDVDAPVTETITVVSDDAFLVVLDCSLRVVVKLAQVKAGLWVRNGASTRGQATHYRDITGRSTMYDQDIYLLQAGLAFFADVDRALVLYLERFGLREMLHAEASGEAQPPSSLDKDTERLLLEEVLLFVIVLLSETASLCGWSDEAMIRREVLHFLALGQGTYSALTRHIPEHMTSHVSFEGILADVSNFRPPDGTADLGIFELKDECYSEVNPFFHHYTRNQRERAEEQLRTHEKKAGRSPDKLVIRGNKVLQGARAGSRSLADSVCRVYRSDVLHLVLWATLQRLLREAEDNVEPSEAVVDTVLHLITMGLAEIEIDFVEQVLSRSHLDITPYEQLHRLEALVKTKHLAVKAAWCLEETSRLLHDRPPAAAPRTLRLLENQPQLKRQQRAETSSGDKAGKGNMDARRAAAKARQQAIMQKFSAQQKTLLDSLEKESSAPAEMSVGDGEGSDNDKEASLGTCILCQEELQRDSDFGTLALITTSRVIRTTPRNDINALREVVEVPLTLDRDASDGRVSRIPQHKRLGSSEPLIPDRYRPQACLGAASGGFGTEDHKAGFRATTCGHMMHWRCFELYNQTIGQRHISQIARNHAEDLVRTEFVCPLCKSLGNVLLPRVTQGPAAPSSSGLLTSAHLSDGLGRQQLDSSPIGDWLRKINIDILKTSTSQNTPTVQESSTGTGCFSSWYADNVTSYALEHTQTPLGFGNSTLQMLDRLLQVLRPMAANTRSQRMAWQSRTILAPISRKLYIPEEVVAYTLSTLEVAQRGQSPPHATAGVSDAVGEATIDLLRSFIYSLRAMAALDHANNSKNGTANKAVNPSDGSKALRQGMLKRLLPHWSSDESVRFPLLLRDPLTILIESVAIIPECLSQVTTLMYYATLVQTIFGLAQPSVWPHTGAGSVSRGIASLAASQSLSESDQATLAECFPDVRWTVGNIVGFVGYARGNVTLGTDNLDDMTLAKMLCSYTLPFLRRASILRRVVCGTPRAFNPSAESQPAEYLRLLSELEILPPAQALPVRAERQAPISSIVEGWIKHCYAPLASLFRPLPINPSPLGGGQEGASHSLTPFSTSNGSSSSAALQQLQAAANHPTLQLEHPHVYELIALPHDLTALLQYSQQCQCRRCSQVPADPALCLFCGELVCYQSFCCMDPQTERGECNRHVASCGGNVGLFFKMKANVVFALYHSIGMFAYSPYLDSHGEVDVGLQKGRPQRLHMRRYDELRKTWLNGGLPTLVARKIEGAMDVGGWDTA